jgi:hypothetical protein
LRHLQDYRQFNNDLGKHINEDWFDEYLKYEAKVFAELRKRFNINQQDEDGLSSFFGKKLETGWKKNTDPKKLAFLLIPKGKKYTLTHWGN